jgi:hypothetical protein
VRHEPVESEEQDFSTHKWTRILQLRPSILGGMMLNRRVPIGYIADADPARATNWNLRGLMRSKSLSD